MARFACLWVCKWCLNMGWVSELTLTQCGNRHETLGHIGPPRAWTRLDWPLSSDADNGSPDSISGHVTASQPDRPSEVKEDTDLSVLLLPRSARCHSASPGLLLLSPTQYVPLQILNLLYCLMFRIWNRISSRMKLIFTSWRYTNGDCLTFVYVVIVVFVVVVVAIATNVLYVVSFSVSKHIVVNIALPKVATIQNTVAHHTAWPQKV